MLVRNSRIPSTIYTRPGADIIGHSEPFLKPSAVVTDLWQTEPNLRPPDPGFPHSVPCTSARKSCWGQRMRASTMLLLLWLLNCHMLPRRLIEIRPSFVIPDSR